MKDYNESKRSDQPVILTILGRFCNKSCAVHYIINVISKAGADVVRTITSCVFECKRSAVIDTRYEFNLKVAKGIWKNV